jgi:hypothetical protein
LHEKAHRLLMAFKPVQFKPYVPLSREATHKIGAELIAEGSKDPLVVAITMVSAPNVKNKDVIRAQCLQAIEDVIKNYDPQQQIEVIDWCQVVQMRLHNTYRKERKKYPAPDPEVLGDAYVRWFASHAEDLSYQRALWLQVETHYRAPYGTSSAFA